MKIEKIQSAADHGNASARLPKMPITPKVRIAMSATIEAIRVIATIKAITQLSALQRMVFVLHDILGYQHNKIGDRLKISEVMSKFHLHQARMKLRRLLRNNNYDLS